MNNKHINYHVLLPARNVYYYDRGVEIKIKKEFISCRKYRFNEHTPDTIQK